MRIATVVFCTAFFTINPIEWMPFFMAARKAGQHFAMKSCHSFSKRKIT